MSLCPDVPAFQVLMSLRPNGLNVPYPHVPDPQRPRGAINRVDGWENGDFSRVAEGGCRPAGNWEAFGKPLMSQRAHPVPELIKHLN